MLARFARPEGRAYAMLARFAGAAAELCSATVAEVLVGCPGGAVKSGVNAVVLSVSRPGARIAVSDVLVETKS